MPFIFSSSSGTYSFARHQHDQNLQFLNPAEYDILKFGDKKPGQFCNGCYQMLYVFAGLQNKALGQAPIKNFAGNL